MLVTVIPKKQLNSLFCKGTKFSIDSIRVEIFGLRVDNVAFRGLCSELQVRVYLCGSHHTLRPEHMMSQGLALARWFFSVPVALVSGVLEHHTQTAEPIA